MGLSESLSKDHLSALVASKCNTSSCCRVRKNGSLGATSPALFLSPCFLLWLKIDIPMSCLSLARENSAASFHIREASLKMAHRTLPQDIASFNSIITAEYRRNGQFEKELVLIFNNNIFETHDNYNLSFKYKMITSLH